MKQRPVNLNLLTIRFPLTAIVSILHRISGVILFFLIPGFLYALQQSFVSPSAYASLQTWINHPSCKFIIWFALSALLYHLIAGCRHIMMDMGYGESRCAGKITAILTFIISAFVIIYLGFHLW